MPSVRRLTSASAWAVGIWAAQAVAAQALPSATFGELASVRNEGTGQEVDSCGGDFCPGAGTVSEGSAAFGSMASATVSATPATPLTTSTSASGGGFFSAFADANAVFSFEWSGPSGAAGSIPTDIALILHTAVSGDNSDLRARATATASVTLLLGGVVVDPTNPFGPGSGTELVSAAGGDLCAVGPANPNCGNADFAGTLIYDLSPNVVYDLELDVVADTSDTSGLFAGSTSQTASASADPAISLDPSFNNPGYTLLLSDGIDNAVGTVASVPEAGTLALFGSGFGIMALLARRRSRRGRCGLL